MREVYGFEPDLAVGAEDRCVEMIGVAGPEHTECGPLRISAMTVLTNGFLILTEDFSGYLVYSVHSK